MTLLVFCRLFGTIMAVLCVLVATQAGAQQQQWSDLNANTPAAIRFITRSANNRLIGGRVGGSPNAVEVWASDNNGSTWYQTGTVASSSTIEYGDPTFLSDGGNLVYSAFREHEGSRYQITVSRSTDGGNSWTFDSVVANNDQNRFLGAPCLWFSRDGMVQIYYDSEQVAADTGHPGWQWLYMNARPKFAFGAAWTSYQGVASRPSDENAFARDGMASVVDLDGSTMMLINEGVDPANTNRNCLYAIRSYDNGRTWDFNSRQTIWAPTKNGALFNAYNPQAIRYGGVSGPVGVSFCTDDDFASASDSSTPVGNRSTHVKFIRTTNSTFGQWGDLQTIESRQTTMYNPGLFEIAPNSLICSIDFFGGRQVIRHRLSA